MKTRLSLLIGGFIILIAIIIFIIFKIVNNDDTPKFKPIYNITYVGDDNLACLTFYKDGSYSLYDCDSEPTNYFFDSENECTYTYKKEYMSFECKYNYSKSKNKKIKILNWTKDEFKFEYNNKVKTFTAK